MENNVRMPFQFPYGEPSSMNVLPFDAHNQMSEMERKNVYAKRNNEDAKKHTLDPYVTGTSVLAIKFKDGVIMAADTLASYGSLARYRTIQRMTSLSKECLMGATGDLSDYQYIVRNLEDLKLSDDLRDDGASLSPRSLHNYFTRLLYSRRNKMDPLWGQFVFGGIQDGKPYLGFSDLRGTKYIDDTVATGYGNHLARPLLRKAWDAYGDTMTKEQAQTLLEDCMRVLYYRDARSYNRMQIAIVDSNGTYISDPYTLETNWAHGNISYKPEINMLPFDVKF